MLPLSFSRTKRYPSLETENIKSSIIVGVKLELTVCFQLIIPVLASIENNSFLTERYNHHLDFLKNNLGFNAELIFIAYLFEVFIITHYFYITYEI